MTFHSAKLLISGEELIDDNYENSTIDTTYIKWLNTEEEGIKGFSEIDNFKIELKSTYTDYIPVEELLLHQGCSKSSIWYSDYQDVDSVTLISNEEAKVLEIKEKELLMEVLSDNSRQLKAIYRLLGSDYEYISYEIKESGYMNIYLCIKDRDSGGTMRMRSYWKNCSCFQKKEKRARMYFRISKQNR